MKFKELDEHVSASEKIRRELRGALSDPKVADAFSKMFKVDMFPKPHDDVSDLDHMIELKTDAVRTAGLMSAVERYLAGRGFKTTGVEGKVVVSGLRRK